MAGDALPRHSLSQDAFREICAGAADPATIAALADAEYSRRRLLLRALTDVAEATRPAGIFADPGPAWEVLADAESRAPDMVREVLLYPLVGVWLHQLVIAARKGGRVMFADLNRMAAAAAVRADVPCDLPVPVRHGVLVLPTVGSLRLPSSFPAGFARLRRSAGHTEVSALDGRLTITIDPLRADVHFRPSPAHTTTAADINLSVWIDDTDPYREFGEPQAPRESSSVNLLEWRKLLDEAWDTLARDHPAWAREVGAGVSVVTPAVGDSASSGFSSGAAIGAVALPAGQSVPELAESLVHEFQHSKLNMVSRVVDLTGGDAQGHFYAPWRDDPRPILAMLHGIFAFTAVAEYWLARADQVPPSPKGAFLLAHRREQVAWALASMADATGVTDLGAELITAVRHRLSACLNASVPARVAVGAKRMIVDHYAEWRLRNVKPDGASIEALAEHWQQGLAPEPPKPGVFRWRPRRPVERSVRQELLQAKLSGHETEAAGNGGAAFRADAAYVADDYEAALAGYLRADHDLGDAVVGVGLCLRAIDRGVAAGALLEHPEIIAALLARLGGDADPVAVATWLAPALTTNRVGAP